MTSVENGRPMTKQEVLAAGPALIASVTQELRLRAPREWERLADELAMLKHALETASDVPKAIEDALRLCSKKAGDYNKHTGRDAYFPLGLPSYAQMIHTKAMRLVNLAATRAEPNFESVRDTCLDLINYAWFLADAIERGEVK